MNARAATKTTRLRTAVPAAGQIITGVTVIPCSNNIATGVVAALRVIAIPAGGM